MNIEAKRAAAIIRGIKDKALAAKKAKDYRRAVWASKRKKV